MKIIIPMSGSGSRFAEAGFSQIKPLIQVQGKPIIHYVIDLFPKETDFLFICQNQHLKDTNIETVLKDKVRDAQIVGIEAHKMGPVWAVSQVLDKIDNTEPCILNYCDFFMDWDYQHFRSTVLGMDVDGAIPCYVGFHPHLLHEQNVYASCKMGVDGYLEEIREKYSFEKDKTRTAHSVGTYYFKSGQLLKKYISQLLTEGPTVNNEYYASLLYNPMVRDGKKVVVYDKIAHFCQWGTPQDLEEYNYWVGAFSALSQSINHRK